MVGRLDIAHLSGVYFWEQTAIRRKQMADNGTVKIKVDLKTNILFMTFSGNIKDRQMAKAYTDVRFSAVDLRQDFVLIADFTTANLAHLSSVSTLQKIIKYLQSRGLGQVIRVIGEENLLLKQIPRISADFASYAPVHVKSLEEAKTLAANPQQPSEAP